MNHEPNTGWRMEDDVSDQSTVSDQSAEERAANVQALITAAERYLLAQTAQRENALRDAIARAKGGES